LGGNALSPGDERGEIGQQFAHTRESLSAVVDLAADGWRMAIVHGNGPQVGNALVRQAMARRTVPPLPIGVLVAATEGWIGYMVQQSLQNALARANVARQVVTMVTQVLVDPDDPTLAHPTKAIGRDLSERTARAIARVIGLGVRESRFGWRCVIGSPRPLEIVEAPMVRSLVSQGHVVIAAGGGGTPVYRHPTLGLEGVDAVIDKDLAAAILAAEIGATVLLILTDVDAVYDAFGTAAATPLRHLTAEKAREHLAAGGLGAGDMAPKVEAALQFVQAGGQRAIIARLDQGRQAVTGQVGTQITLN